MWTKIKEFWENLPALLQLGIPWLIAYGITLLVKNVWKRIFNE